MFHQNYYDYEYDYEYDYNNWDSYDISLSVFKVTLRISIKPVVGMIAR